MTKQTTNFEGTDVPRPTWNDATLRGTDCREWQAQLDRKITIFTGDSGKLKKWPTATATWRDFIEGDPGAGGFSHHRQTARKSSLAVVMASFTGKARLAGAVTHIHALGLDFDSGTSRADIESKIEAMGVAAFVYTTFTDQKTESKVAVAQIERAFPDLEGDLTDNQLRTYLRDHDTTVYSDAHIDSATITDHARATDDGLKVVYSHAPLDKFRVILPFKESVEVKALGRDLNERKAAWADKVIGAAREWLDGHPDVACTDMTRVFYMPEHPRGTTGEITIFQGPPVSFEDVPSASKRSYMDEYRTPVTQRGTAGDAVFQSGESAKRWAAECADDLLVAEMIRHHAPDRIKEDKGDLLEIECPIHGSEGCSDRACYVKDADGAGGGFQWGCQRNRCAGYDRLDFLAAALREWPELDESLVWHEESEGGFLLPAPDDDVIEDDNLSGLDQLRRDPAEQSTEPQMTQDGTREPPSGGEDDVPPMSMNIADPLGKNLSQSIEVLKARWVVVNVGGKTLFMPRPDPARATDQGVQFFTEAEFVKFHKNRSHGKKNKKYPAKDFAEDADRHTEITFAPPPTKAEHRAFNLWHGYKAAAAPRPGAPCGRIKAFMRDVICDGRKDVFDWLWLWLAHLAQKPGEKPGTALVIQGTGGCGKSYFGNILTRLFAPYTVFADRAEHVTGQFNRHLATAVLLVSDEALFGGDPRVSGQIKSMVTTNVQRVEAKGVDSIEVPSFLRCVFIGNPKRVVPIESNGSDRRYLCLGVSDIRKDDTNYFSEIEAEIEAGGLATLFAELTAHVPTDALPWSKLRVAPETGEKKHMRRLSLPPVVRKMIESIEDGEIALREESGRMVRYALAEDGENLIARDHMRQALARWADTRDGGQDAQEVLTDLFDDAVSTTRRKVCFQKQEYGCEWEGDSRERAHCYVLPSRTMMLAQIDNRFDSGEG